MSDEVVRAFRPRIRVRCDRCGQPTSETAGAYQVRSGPARGTYCKKQCWEIARDEMNTGKIRGDTKLPKTDSEEVE